MWPDGFTRYPTGIEFVWVVSVHLALAILFATVLARRSPKYYRASHLFIIMMVGAILGHLLGSAVIVALLGDWDPQLWMQFYFEYHAYQFTICTTLINIGASWLLVGIVGPRLVGRDKPAADADLPAEDIRLNR